MVDIKDINTNLQNLGLDSIESRIYVELMEKGVMSVLELSRALNIPRTTVYRVTEKMVSKKFVEWVVKENSLRAKAVEPTSLNFLIKQKEEELDDYKNSLKELESMLTGIAENLPKTEVRYYKGKEGLRQMMWNCLKAKNEVVGYSVYGRAEIVGEKFVDNYVLEFKKRKLRDRTVINETALQFLSKKENWKIHQQTLKDIHFISKKSFYVAGDTSIYNNIYAVCFWKEGEVVGFEIENKEFVKVQKSIFEIMWQISTPVDKLLISY